MRDYCYSIFQIINNLSFGSTYKLTQGAIPMDYCSLGASQLKVSKLCLGTMMFGAQTNKSVSGQIIKSAKDNGVNFIDTADVYVKGESERVVGELIKSSRDWWILATKAGQPFEDLPNHGGLSKKWLCQSIEKSLLRLNTDYIDIFYLHRDYEPESLVEAVTTMGDMIRSGKIRYFGLSNFRGWRIAEVLMLCKDFGVPPPIVCQPYYNAVNRMPEVEVLPVCKQFGLGVVPFSPIARGVLTGKYDVGQVPSEGTRAGRKDKRMMETEFRDESITLAKKFVQYADDKGVSPGQFAVAWVLANPIVNSVIGGPRTLEQWEDYYGALKIQLTRDDEQFVNELVAPGHPSTPGYTDPAFPVTGRPDQA